MDRFVKILTFFKKRPTLSDCLLVTLLTIPAFISILNWGYFSMHDDQHIARLFLFDKAIKEGNIYPRWVDGLGFGFGYPLFNFYPPLIYIIAEFLHLVGFSLIWSIKMVVVTGFISAAIGMYLLVKRIYNYEAAIVSSVLYTFFFYHGVTAYVRGAFAEFFSFSILPFLFLSFIEIYKKATIKNALWCGFALALLILCHPLIAFPSVLFTVGFFVFLWLQTEKTKRTQFAFIFGLAMIVGLSLSAFFWLPSMLERKFTYVDNILTTELASYAIHFVQPIQFFQSNWGYGGSGPGLDDGVTFQLGKVHIFLAAIAIVIIASLYILQHKKQEKETFGMFIIGMLLFSLFMTVDSSKFIWDSMSFLWYLQFPWRFLTFTAIFISILGGATFAYFFQFIRKLDNSFLNTLAFLILLVSVGGITSIYSKYFHPQEYRAVTDTDLTTKGEISWRISRTSFEFVPKGVQTTKSDLGTTILAINPSDIPQKEYNLLNGRALVESQEIKSSYKSFIVRVGQPVVFQLNTFNFPGWEAVILDPGTNQEIELTIRDDNPFKLITVDLPPGEYILSFTFADTMVRFIANVITLLALLAVILMSVKEKETMKLIPRQFK